MVCKAFSLRWVFAATALAGMLGGCAEEFKEEPVATPHANPAAAGAKARIRPDTSAGFPADYEDWSRLGYRLDWSGFPFPTNDKVDVLEVAGFQDIVVVLDRSSEVVALETTTGERRWASSLANKLTKFVGIARDPLDPGRVIVSSESDAYVMAATTGTLLARETYARVVDTPPVMAGNVAIFGTLTGEVMAHMMGRSVKAWGFQSGGAVTAAPVRLADGTIAAVSQAGDVMFLTSRGQMLGRGRILKGLGNDPVTDGNLLYIAGLDQSIWCFAPSGSQIWRYRTSDPLRSQPAVLNGVVYCDVPRDGLVALESISGKELWKSPQVRGDVIGSNLSRTLVWNAPTRTLVAVDPGTGDAIERVTIPQAAKLVSSGGESPILYVVSDLGVVGKFIPKK